MENILPWLALKDVRGIGNYLFKKLIDSFESPESVLNAPEKELLKVEGISKNLALKIQRHSISSRLKKEIDLALNKNIKIIHMFHKMYPPLLLQLPDPPPYLYVYGSIDNNANNIAVVGSRNATSYGISTTKRLCKDLASIRINVISGMARGIDTAAHQGALMGKGKTTAVLGSGLNRIYPRENIKLSHQIAENGAVISEFPFMTDPEPHNFPQRNRIISGMSLGTVVIEATKRSGSLITARLAAEQGREVFAVPGNINSFKSTGTHSLLKQGAKLVEHAQDIIEELSPGIVLGDEIDTPGHHKSESKLVNLSEEERLVFESLEPYPIQIDNITRKLALDAGKISSILLKLELQGIVKQSPGKLFFISEE